MVMKKLLLIPVILFSLITLANAQPVIWSQGFEGIDSTSLPAGWSVYNNSLLDTIEPNWNWTIRDSGSIVPGVSEVRRTKVKSGIKSIGVSWYTGASSGISDAWLVSRKLPNVPGDALFSFWATGGTPTLLDSLQIWISTTDSTPAAFLSNPANHLNTIQFPPNPIYGLFDQYYIDLGPYAGQNVYIGFRYNMDVASDGVLVQLDDVEYQGTVSITQNGTNVPDKFALNQNYPNPFNPSTKINFDLAKSSYVKLTVFNSLGQVVENIFEGQKPAGSYTADFDGRSLSSGTYYYRLETDFFVETKKMQLVK